jgi:hypothetical protein
MSTDARRPARVTRQDDIELAAGSVPDSLTRRPGALPD